MHAHLGGVSSCTLTSPLVLVLGHLVAVGELDRLWLFADRVAEHPVLGPTGGRRSGLPERRGRSSSLGSYFPCLMFVALMGRTQAVQQQLVLVCFVPCDPHRNGRTLRVSHEEWDGPQRGNMRQLGFPRGGNEAGAPKDGGQVSVQCGRTEGYFIFGERGSDRDARALQAGRRAGGLAGRPQPGRRRQVAASYLPYLVHLVSVQHLETFSSVPQDSSFWLPPSPQRASQSFFLHRHQNILTPNDCDYYNMCRTDFVLGSEEGQVSFQPYSYLYLFLSICFSHISSIIHLRERETRIKKETRTTAETPMRALGLSAVTLPDSS